ncbi:TPA: hypothetical protein I0F96_RS00535 [Enterococcus faecalis]|uniref:hypothetical protein n=2 Tax=Enterococcus faecalis TaxID=1351 RepID=UPI0001B2EA49|nr:hypothetical protein [Enterococcus faecalis]EEU79914.1 predicted protein [Enterococcus faecalis Fly1]EGO8958619.1 hypothetical protein [Enterococcus faecalis]MDU1451416.1 hypothetical protein [Enterococcus faecalis]PQC13605.1 hypothetical protein CUM91_08835 [Enterococcus faecalis]HBI1770679.1 hypothetical protein [Enterococcus faecalis]
MQTSKNTSLIFGKYMNQQTLMKELHIGFDTLRILRLNGLEVITIGRQNLYDLENLEVVLSQLKQTD